MGNTQKSSFHRIRSESTEEKASSFLTVSSSLNQMVINFPEIQKKFHLELTSKAISFERFCVDFEKEVNLPPDAELHYYTFNTLTSDIEPLEKDYLLCNINKEIVVDLVNRGSLAKIINFSLTTIKDNTIEALPTATFNFLPLKYSLPFQNQNDHNFRLFKANDTQLADPLDIHKSLLDYNNSEEENAENINLILYYPSSDDIIKVAVLNDKRIDIFQVDKYMRIPELTDLCNRVARESLVLCSSESGFKLYEDLTIGILARQRKTLSMTAVKVQDYYMKYPETRQMNSTLKSEVQIKLLNLPD